MSPQRARAVGKFLHAGDRRILVKGVTYGTAARPAQPSPSRLRMRDDFRTLAANGVNTICVDAPTAHMLDDAAHNGLHVIAGIPWQQHVAFLDVPQLAAEIRQTVATAVRDIARHPALLVIALGNDIPSSIVRWLGPRRVERFLRELYDEAKTAAPDTLFTYVNSPATEFLSLPFFDVCSFKVGLHAEGELRAYLARLQHIAGHKPLLLTETRTCDDRDCRVRKACIAVQLRAALSEGACGAIVSTSSDDGIDAEESGAILAEALADFRSFELQQAALPSVSVVVCAFDAADTIDECLRSLDDLNYSNFEVIVVNDGSRDATGAIARRHPRARVIDVPNGGLSAARNIGLEHARGEIVAYTDADVRVDPDWLTYLVQPFVTSDVVGSGGPNVVPDDDPWMAQCVARSPGAPTQVLLSDRVAEHVPGCNMAFRRDALRAIGGFNPIYLRAGDDVDVCWRLQAKGQTIGFAPSALVWHRHRASMKAYWRQQVGYGEGESWLTADHPEKFLGGRAQWQGRVYSPIPFVRAISGHRVHAGVWGTAAFPSVYRTHAHPIAFLPHLARWQMVVASCLLSSVLAFSALHVRTAIALFAIAVLGLAITAGKCLVFALHSDIDALPCIGRLRPGTSRAIYRMTIAWLHAIQPLARARGRIRGALYPPHRIEAVRTRRTKRSRGGSSGRVWAAWRVLVGRSIQLQFWNERWFDRATLLRLITERLRTSSVARAIEIDDGWRSDHDIRVVAGRWTAVDIRGLVEDHGAGRCLFRISLRLRASAFAMLFAPAAAVILGAVFEVLATRAGVASSALTGITALFWSVRRVRQTLAGIQSAIEAAMADVGMVPVLQAPVEIAGPHPVAAVGRVAANVTFEPIAAHGRAATLRSLKAKRGVKAANPVNPVNASRQSGREQR